MKKTLKISIVSPTGMEFERDDVVFIKARTTNGDVGILPEHINYVSSLGEGQLLIRFGEDKEEKSYYISGGFMELRDNVVIILAEDVIDSSQEEAIRLQRQQAIEKETREKLKEERNIVGTKKRIQDSLRK